MSYPVRTMRRAHDLYEAGFSTRKISELLDAEGLGRPTPTTVNRWVNPDYKARQLSQVRGIKSKQRATEANFKMSGFTEQYRRAFAARLKVEGLTNLGIRKVFAVVFDEPITDHWINSVLVEEGMLRPSALRRRADRAETAGSA